MRKIFKFLALLVVVFALPQWAHAWDYNGGSDPNSITVHFTNGNSGDLKLNFDSSNSDYKWSNEFTASNAWVNFTVQVWSNSGYTKTYGENIGTGTVGDWVLCNDNKEGSAFYHSNLTAGTKYRLELKDNGDAEHDGFYFRIVEAPKPSVTLRIFGGDSYKDILGTATSNTGVFEYDNVSMTGNTYFVLSTKSTSTGYQSLKPEIYTAGTDESIPTPISGVACRIVNDKAYKVSATGTYNIKVDLNNNKLYATKTGGGDEPDPGADPLYLYSTVGPKMIATATSPVGGVYTFTYKFNAGDGFVLGTQPNLTEWDGGLNSCRFSPSGSDVNVPVPNNGFSQQGSNGKAWIATVTGVYTITVNWNSKTLTATVEETLPSNVHMPLTKADFEGGKKHYFLVGERMGEWRLQPEWEFKQVGNELVLENRYIYDGVFAIGVVDDYVKYTKHLYDYYSPNPVGDTWNINNSTLECNDDFSWHKQSWTNSSKGDTRKPNKVFYADFQNVGDYWDGRGVFMSKITVGLKNGLPSTIKLEKGTEAKANEYRMFTIVGSEIYNSNFSNKSGFGTTPMLNKSDSKTHKEPDKNLGWQEGWIQYDPATNKPYLDANGEYLYHTSFTPDYLLKHSVPFNLTLNDGSEFSYSSDELQFVIASELKDIDTDPYRDFYNAFDGDKKLMATNQTRNGGTEETTYRFKVNVKGEHEEGYTPTQDWECYVVRDMWIAGEIKFWTGWGGNIDWTRGGEGGIATWHGPNGGPNSAHYQVHGYEVLGDNASNVEIYGNKRNSADNNYKVSESNKPVYFNRVVLWFNNTNGVENSFIQFIQATAGPAIWAKTIDNENVSGKKNWIEYNWFIQKPEDFGTAETEGAKQVVSYEITRYRLENGNFEPIGYPEGQIVNIEDKNVTVADLYEGVAGTTAQTAFTTHQDKGMNDDYGFNPGTYRYDIYVTYRDENGVEVRKPAVSNRVFIYGDDAVSPDAAAYQLLELRGAYDDAHGDHYDSGKEAVKAIVGGETVYNYMTYNPVNGGSMYVLNVKAGADGKSTVVKEIKPIDSARALDFINNNPDKYNWTSDYLVRCLDNADYMRVMQTYVDNNLIKGDIPTPKLTVTEGENAGLGTAEKVTISGTTKEYYALIAKRGGNLSSGTLTVDLDYSYVNAEDKETSVSANDKVTIVPVMPKPFAPKYRYTYQDPERGKWNSGKYAMIDVPVENSTSDQNWGAGKKQSPVYVKMDNNFNTRDLNLQVDFNRPNVTKEIYENYDIQYTVNMANNDQTVVPLEVEAVLHDIDAAAEKYPNRYRIEVKNMHPMNEVFPVVTFSDTKYVPNASAPKDFKENAGTFGNGINVKAKHSIKVNAEGGFEKIYLGKIKRENGWYWMYKGHKDFNDPNETLEPTEADNEAFEAASLTPLYYLFEISNTKGDKYTYPYLVPHVNGHLKGNGDTHPDTGLVLDDEDPLIGTYIAKGFKSDENPTVTVTAIYLFERNVQGDHEYDYSDMNFNNLEVKSFTIKNGAAAKSTMAKSKNDKTNTDLANGGSGDLPDAGGSETVEKNMNDVYNPTGYRQYVAMKGATYEVKLTDDTVTGVEDVLAPGEDGEVVYYNLQGMRIDEPTTAGVYLRVEGKKVSKVVVK